MNKKGGTLGIFSMIIFTVVVIGLSSGIAEMQEDDKACEEMGYLKYEYKQDFEFCEDKNGNLHYIKHECDYMIPILELFPNRCIVNKIKVGEVYHDALVSGDEQ